MQLKSIFKRSKRARRRTKARVDLCDDTLTGSLFNDVSSQQIACDLRACIEKRRWEEVLLILESEENDTAFEATTLTDFESGDNILHLACKNYPPLDVVALIIAKLPNLAKETNHREQYALHYAAQWGACPEVVHLILKANQLAVKQKDIDDRTPLLLACKDYKTNQNCLDCSHSSRQAIASTIKILAKSFPGAANLEDNKNLSCIEYAIISGFELSIVRFIQKASCLEWKRQKEAKRTSSETQ